MHSRLVKFVKALPLADVGPLGIPWTEDDVSGLC